MHTAKFAPFAEEISFSTCCFLRERRGVRAAMVKAAIDSWTDLLDLPFKQRIFLDDHSPKINGLRLLLSSKLIDKFDHVQYQTINHPPHSNFGIVASLELAHSPYILHLDDDVRIVAPVEECYEVIQEAIVTMGQDPTVLGCNLLSMDPKTYGTEWRPGEPHSSSGVLFHPNKYFGTAACVVRRSLLNRIPYPQIVLWGESQPSNWEQLVSNNPREFLARQFPTPFCVPSGSYFFNSMSRISMRGQLLFLARGLFR
jgi:hypothetical protein